MNKNQFRQGDVLIERIRTIPKLHPMPREDDRVILAHGEATGHAHAIADLGVEQYQSGEPGVTFLEVAQAVAMLTHEEHATIELPRGHYRVRRQREYSPEAIRNVAD